MSLSENLPRIPVPKIVAMVTKSGTRNLNMINNNNMIQWQINKASAAIIIPI